MGSPHLLDVLEPSQLSTCVKISSNLQLENFGSETCYLQKEHVAGSFCRVFTTAFVFFGVRDVLTERGWRSTGQAAGFNVGDGWAIASINGIEILEMPFVKDLADGADIRGKTAGPFGLKDDVGTFG